MLITVLVCADALGSLPLFIAMQIKETTNPGVLSELKNSSMNFSVLGLDKNVLFVLMFLPFAACLGAFVLLFKPIHGKAISYVINGTNSIRWKRFFISALIWMVFSGIYLIFYVKSDPSNFSLNNSTSSLIYIALISLILVPLQAGFEEVIFRGYLMQGFASISGNRWFPLLITSVLFALMHSTNPEVKEFGFLKMIPQYLLFGLAFGIVSILDDGIEAAMGAHTANNIFLCIFLTNSSSAIQTSALYEQKVMRPGPEFIALLITAVVFIALLALIFKWKNFGLLWGRVTRKSEPSQVV
jgi:uncharacterized protein